MRTLILFLIVAGACSRNEGLRAGRGTTHRDRVETTAFDCQIEEILGRQGGPARTFGQGQPLRTNPVKSAIHHLGADQPVGPKEIEVEDILWPFSQELTPQLLSLFFYSI